MIKSIGNHVRRHRLSGPKYKNLNYLLTLIIGQISQSFGRAAHQISLNN